MARLKKDEIKRHEELVIHHRELYYNKDPLISDDEFDKLIENLRFLSPSSPVLKQVGALPKRNKIVLPVILGSLDKTGITNILPWMAKQDDTIFGSYKLDGTSVYAEWTYGILTMLSTRGNSTVGEDILFKSNKLQLLPTKLPKLITVASRGEATIIGKIPKGYKTRRSAANGIINRDDLQGADKVSIVFYELIKHPKLPKTEASRFKAMKELGLTVPANFIFSIPEITKKPKYVIQYLTDILTEKAKLDYDMDGIVLTKNISERENIKYPKLKVAFKIDTAPTSTTISSIEWNVTRTGRLIPIMHIDMIEVEGVEINHPSGHNYSYIKQKKMGVGAVVEVVRSGDVIPYIKGVIKPSTKITMPKRCPSCDSILGFSGVDLVCNNKKCRGQKIANVEYFIKTLGTENISTPTLEKLNVDSIKKFYLLEKEDITSTDGLGDISADTIIEERNKTLRTTPDRLLAAFGISLIGLKNAKKITDIYFPTQLKFKRMFGLPKNKLSDMIIDITGLGPAVAGNFSRNIKKFEPLYKFLKSLGLKFEIIDKTNRLQGKSFQFTGTMELSRDKFEMMVLNHGGRLSSVTKKLDYLVVADVNTTSTKAARARELGIKIITEKHFMKLVSPGG